MTLPLKTIQDSRSGSIRSLTARCKTTPSQPVVNILTTKGPRLHKMSILRPAKLVSSTKGADLQP